MSYQAALEAAGAKILAFETFGSPQGEWWAKVEYDGEIGYVAGTFGSCIGCDAFEREFGCDEPTPERLAAFGLTYLGGLMGQGQAEGIVGHAIVEWDWDEEQQTILAWLQANG